MKKQALTLFRITMVNMFNEKEVIDYVMPSKESAEQRWMKKYGDSGYYLHSINEVRKLDGYKISFFK